MNALTTTNALDEELMRVLQNSLYPGAKPESIALVLAYCKVQGIDPMLKPVHIVPTNVKVGHEKYEWRDVLMPGIADYRIKAARSGEYGGKSEPEFGPDVTEKVGDKSVTYPAWCRITVRRIVQGHAREFTANERWLENYATAGSKTDTPNRMWLKRPYGQLAKCAEAQALRMGFPEFSGGYTAEEMEGKTGFSGQTVEHEPEPDARDALNEAIPMTKPVPLTRPAKGDRFYREPPSQPPPHQERDASDELNNSVPLTNSASTVTTHAPTLAEKPPTKTRTRSYREIIDSLRIALRDATTHEEVDRILCGVDVAHGRANFKDDALAELEKLIIDVMAKWWPEDADASHEPESAA